MARRRASLTMQLSDIARIGVRKYLGNGRDYDGVAGRARNVTPAWNAIRELFFEAEVKLFMRDGATEEHPAWLPNNPDYAKWKSEEFGLSNYAPMRMTRALMYQMTGASGEHYERRSPRRFEIGSNAQVYRWSGVVDEMSLDNRQEDVGGLNAEGGSKFIFPPGSKRVMTAASRETIKITNQNIEDFSDVLVDYVFNTMPASGRRSLAMGNLYRRMTSRNTGRSYTSLAGRASRYERL